MSFGVPTGSRIIDWTNPSLSQSNPLVSSFVLIKPTGKLEIEEIISYCIMSDSRHPTSDTALPSREHSRDNTPAMKRFLASMEINFEKWHDGIGYDLAALDEINDAERDDIVRILSTNLDDPWRTFEALAHIGTPKALAIIKTALKHLSLEVRIAASRFVKGAELERESVLIEALEKSDIYSGLSQALDQIETFHPQGVVDALLRGLLKRGDSGAVNFAGMLIYIYGKADSSFDWDRRQLFLRFDTNDLNDREGAFVEICQIIGVNPEPYLPRRH